MREQRDAILQLKPAELSLFTALLRDEQGATIPVIESAAHYVHAMQLKRPLWALYDLMRRISQRVNARLPSDNSECLGFTLGQLVDNSRYEHPLDLA